MSRGGFYHQFDSRPAFLEDLLDAWERRSTDDVLDRVEREGGDARTKVGKAGMLTFSDALLPVDLAVRDWALALLAFSVAIGNHFIAADHGGRSRAQVLRRATALLFG